MPVGKCRKMKHPWEFGKGHINATLVKSSGA